MKNIIPPITERLGRYWNQPPTSAILIDDTHALMEQKTLEDLAEYSATIPTGVYPGKMWKRHDGIFDKVFLVRGGTAVWLLMWYDEGTDPLHCTIESREIILC